jgi:hypothetical protein
LAVQIERKIARKQKDDIIESGHVIGTEQTEVISNDEQSNRRGVIHVMYAFQIFQRLPEVQKSIE